MAAPLIPMDERDGWIWIDGKMVPWREARVHILIHSLHYAGAAFEGERAYGGKVFKLAEHSQRLVNSCSLLGYECPYSAEEVARLTRDVVAKNNIQDGYVRPIAWRGAEVIGVASRRCKIHLAIAAFPWPSYYSDEARLQGIRLAMSAWARPAPNCAPTASKASGLYMICTLSKDAAEAAGYDDALMLDYRGHVAEATGANFFMTQKGELHTPTPDCFLDGITRQTVIDLARQRGWKVVERVIRLEELRGAEEVFLTGTAVEVTPIREIQGRQYQVGPIARQLMKDYSALVRT